MKVIFIIIAIVLFGCNSEKSKEFFIDNKMDTINFHIMDIKKIDNKKQAFFNKYYQRVGIKIQQYYQIIDSLPIDLDLNNSIDTLLILTPISLENPEFFDKTIDSFPKRLLVEVLNINGKSKIRNVYDNLISDVGGVLSKYIGITKTINGFEIKHEAGNKYSWIYNVEFSVSKNENISLKKIHKECGYDDNKIVNDINYDNYPIGELNLLDSMKVNCNCDASWKFLSKE